MKKKLMFLSLSLLLVACAQNQDSKEEEKPDEVIDTKKADPIDVTFNAVGDNLIHGAIYYDNFTLKNSNDFTSIYSEIKPYIEAVDVSYLNQETVLGGQKLGLMSYPMFNSPQEIGDAVADTGFDWINHASNHSMDMGEAGIINTLDFWDTHPEISVTGIARNKEERDALNIIERNGVKFGLLSYTYGTNGIPLPDGKEFLVNLIDTEKIEQDILRLQANVDSVLVSMHWGTEYSFETDEYQRELAQFLADLNVDVIVGSHPHVIQPMDYITGKNGNETLVIYSLGNFLSAQDVNYRMLGGMANWTIQFDPNTKTTKVKDASFTPTVTHFDPGFVNFKVYRLKDYSDELAAQHGLADQQLSKAYFKNLVDDVMNDKIPLDY